ncbi:MAG: tRNA (cytidine(34)-2'-O)-methyltransferase [Oscillospiraceae bacterium]|nr:tRNA (cytidine(34)-2'-O)-methyltransferase [Oscillospiraceae bacterium]
MNIVLFEPEIPVNTGNIGRTCVATGAKLHLIRPLGFFIDDKSLKRAGMDYWQELDVRIYDNFDDFLTKNDNPRIFMVETNAEMCYNDVKYVGNDFIMFGKETTGIPIALLERYKDTVVRIPMIPGTRSLNLSNAAAIVLFEALRQTGFKNLK